VTRAVALAALITLLLAGCGGGDSDPGSAAAIDLKVTLWPNGEAGDSITWRLQCEPPGGDHPDPEAACMALTAVADPFGPVAPPDRCEEIPGSDEDVAAIDGDYRGRPVHSRFTRANACVSGRWDRIAPVFPTGS
jgi:subtilisin inhibitor-like